MEATLKQIETAAAGADELKDKEFEAMRELTSFELSLAGGGYGSMMFE
jgi:hypothetical protein